MATLDSYPEANYDYDADMQISNGDARADGQNGVKQTLYVQAKVTSCKFYLKRTGAGMSGNLVAKLYTQDGNGKPLAQVGGDSGGVAIGGVGTSYGLITFTWSSNHPTMNMNTNYCLFVDTSGLSGQDGSNYLSNGADQSSPSHAGAYIYRTAAWNVTASYDSCFYIYGDALAQGGGALSSFL